MNEKASASHILLDAGRRNVTLLRNNSGGFYDERGNFVRFGLGSYKEKDKKKSSDYIGWTPVFITPDMVGRVLPVFTAIETKQEGWKFNSSDKHSLYQKNFIDMVLRAGGYAGFATNVEEARRITGYEPW